MRRIGYTYSNRLNLRHRGSIFPTNHDSRGPRTNTLAKEERFLAAASLQRRTVGLIDRRAGRPATTELTFTEIIMTKACTASAKVLMALLQDYCAMMAMAGRLGARFLC